MQYTVQGYSCVDDIARRDLLLYISEYNVHGIAGREDCRMQDEAQKTTTAPPTEDLVGAK